MMRLLAVISTAGSLLLGATTTAVAADHPVTLTGTLRLGGPGQKPYSVIKPAEWNGPPAQREWFLSHGYAIGGMARTQNVSAYEIHQYIDRNWGTYQPPAASPQSAGAGGASRRLRATSASSSATSRGAPDRLVRSRTRTKRCSCSCRADASKSQARRHDDHHHP